MPLLAILMERIPYLTYNPYMCALRGTLGRNADTNNMFNKMMYNIIIYHHTREVSLSFPAAQEATL